MIIQLQARVSVLSVVAKVDFIVLGFHNSSGIKGGVTANCIQMTNHVVVAQFKHSNQS